MLSRLAAAAAATARPLHLCLLSLSLTRSSTAKYNQSPSGDLIPSSLFFFQPSRTFSKKTNGGGGDGNGTWKFSPATEEGDSIFNDESGELSGISDEPFEYADSTSDAARLPKSEASDIFGSIDEQESVKELKGTNVDDWETSEGYKPWTLGEDDEEKGDVFDIGDVGEGIGEMDGGEFGEMENARVEEQQQLERKEQELLGVLKGPNRAFGDLIAASGITEDMIDSLILLKDVRGVQGLPPLSEIEDKAIARLNATSSRAEVERKKQEEIAQSRVRQVDEKGRAYGTGRRKCSIARVWIQPGDGKFIVNDKQFDAYFPILDHRADLLQPFTVTKTLGLWNVDCTVKGGGVSGQVGAIRLGISRALQNWEPGLRPYLKAAGYLTRDPRVVERKKPGKAKARKSFQWVKR